MHYRSFGIVIGAILASGAQASTGLRPVGSPGDWITTADYPTSALQTFVEGSTGFRLDVGPDGHVASCTITLSSGTAALDDAACALLRARAHFAPATDTKGNAIASTYSSRVRWQIPNRSALMSKGRFLTCVANDRDVIQVETPFGCGR